MFLIICFFSILFIPSIADAWGPLTHVYLGYQVLDIGAALIPAGIYGILKKYRNDFLYGNLSADIILGRRFQGYEKNSHNWNVAWKLLEDSRTDRQKAFAYGYIMHLCSDTVVHNIKPNGVPFNHSLLEVKSDSIVEKKYRRVLKNLDKYMQRRNDLFLESKLESLIFSFKTNKRIFKGLLLLSRLPNYTPMSNFIDRRFPYEITVGDIYNFQEKSLERMIDVLNKGRDSKVLEKHPMLRHSRHRKKAS
jgi:hypothetical protein